MGETPARIEHVTLRTFAHATEDPARVERALLFAAGAGEGKAAAAARKAIVRTSTRGHWGNPIGILELVLRPGRAADRFVAGLQDESVRPVLRVELDERLDEDLVLWLRLDKQEAFQGRLRLAQHDDVVHARVKVATYPRRREAAESFLRELLEPGTAPAKARHR